MTKQKRSLDLSQPTDRARYICENMSGGIKHDVLSQYEDMSTGGDGGSSGSYLPGEPSMREKYYRYKSNTWFRDVLTAYDSLQRANKEVQL